MTTGPFDDLPVIGMLSRIDAAIKLCETGEDKAAEAVEHAGPPHVTMRGADWCPFRDRAWQYAAHSVAFMPAGGDAGT